MEFKEILLNTAVCAIAADEIIDERETEALYNIEKKSPYFSSIDLEQTLKSSLDTCMNDIESFANSTLDCISKEDLNVVQELTLLEISLRIVVADDIVVEKEKQFIKRLRGVLKVDDFIISERFGAIEYLGISAPEEKHGFEDKKKADENIREINK
tara:strand:- start:106 stop:573 length:468 start_codon:yes stop_codon:yes gene_type:complete